MTGEIPDYFEPLVGWRIWRSIQHNGNLQALAMAYYWTPGKIMRCRCNACGHPSKPTMDNHEGFYAFKSLRELVTQEAHSLSIPRNVYHGAYYDPVRYVVGQVYIWGTIVDHTHGYRAECAYPKALIVSNEWEKEAAAPWGVEVEIGNVAKIWNDLIKQKGGV